MGDGDRCSMGVTVMGDGEWCSMSVTGDSDWCSMGVTVMGDDWSSMSISYMRSCIGDWMMSDSCNRCSGDNSLVNSSRSFDNSIESMDIISSVGDSSHSAVRFDKGVTSTDDITVAALLSGFLISSQTIGDRVSVIVLWMRIVRLSADCYLCDMSDSRLVVDGWGVMSDSQRLGVMLGVDGWLMVGDSEGWLGVSHSWLSISHSTSVMVCWCGVSSELS